MNTQTFINTPNTWLVLDDDPKANNELTTFLQTWKQPQPATNPQHPAIPSTPAKPVHPANPSMIPSSVRSAQTLREGLTILRTEPVDLLFIRITWWDDYREKIPEIPNPPARVVFLSAKLEKRTEELHGEVDFHLQTPYRVQPLRKIFDRLSDPGFQPRSLEIFFLRVGTHPHVIPISSLHSVRSGGGLLTIRTDNATYQIMQSLLQFERRLPKQFCRINRQLLVAWPHLAASGHQPADSGSPAVPPRRRPRRQTLAQTPR